LGQCQIGGHVGHKEHQNKVRARRNAVALLDRGARRAAVLRNRSCASEFCLSQGDFDNRRQAVSDDCCNTVDVQQRDFACNEA
jgi:hypothetical protein